MRWYFFFAITGGAIILSAGCQRDISIAPNHITQSMTATATPTASHAVYTETPTPTTAYPVTLGTTGSLDAGTFKDTSGVAAGYNEIYVGDYQDNVIEVFDLQGHYLSSFPANNPCGLALSTDSHLYAADYDGGRVDEYTLTGVPVASFYGSGFNSASSNFSGPTGVVVDAANHLWVCDYEMDQVCEVDQTDAILAASGGISLNGPFNLALDQNGNVYVTDTLNNRIVEYNPSLVYQTQFGEGGPGNTANGNFFMPEGLTIDADGHLIVCDAGNARVQKITTSGAYLETIGASAGFYWPWFTAVDTSHHVFVSDNHNLFVYIFQDN